MSAIDLDFSIYKFDCFIKELITNLSCRTEFKNSWWSDDHDPPRLPALLKADSVYALKFYWNYTATVLIFWFVYNSGKNSTITSSSS